MPGNNCDFSGDPPYDCTGCDLSNRDLSGIDLRGAILKGTVFKGVIGLADLRDATMGDGTDFSGVDLTGVTFDDRPGKFGSNAANPTILNKARITFSQLGAAWRCLDLTDAEIIGLPAEIPYLEASRCNLTRLDLSRKALKGAAFNGCNLTGANLSDCDLANALFIGSAVRCNLTGANLSKAKCPGAVFDRAILIRTDFTGATLGGASFLQAGLQGTRFENTDVTECVFSSSPSFSLDATTGLTSFQSSRVLYKTLNKAWSYLNLEGAEIVGLNPGVNLDNLEAKYAVLSRMDLTGYQMNDAELTGATINRCIFDGATMNRARMKVVKGFKASFRGTTLDDAHFGYIEDDQTILPGADFTDAKLNRAIFSKADLGPYKEGNTTILTKFNKAVMTNMEFSMANLTGATFTGGVLMHNSNFTSANFTKANLTGAQMGSFARMFEVKSADAAYSRFYDLLRALSPYGLDEIFRNNGYTLSARDTTVTMDIPDASWSVSDSSTAKQYNVLKWTSTDNVTALIVSAPIKAATLSGAIMYNAVLTDADLRNVNASEVQLYGQEVKVDYAKFHGINLSNSNLGNISMQKAVLYNAVLSRSNLIKGNLTGAELAGASMEYSNLQGAIFTETNLDGVNLTNCAISLDIPQTNTVGVYLFSLTPNKPAYEAVRRELEAIPARSAPAEPLVVLSSEDTERTRGAKIADIARCADALDRGSLAAFIAATPRRKTKLSPTSAISKIESGKGWIITDPANGAFIVWDGPDRDNNRALMLQATTQPEALATGSADIARCADALDNGDLAAFLAATHPPGRQTVLSPNSVIAVIENGKGWLITDPAKEAGVTFTVWDGFDTEARRALMMQRTPAGISRMFEETGSIKLRYQAVVFKNPTAPNCWNVDNDSYNNGNLELGYIKYLIVKETNGSFSVYGTALRIKQMDATGKLVIDTRTYNSTVFARKGEKTQDCQPDGSGSVFGKDTICPNTLKFSTNKSDSQPWMVVLRAPTLPTPPACVPTLSSGCVSSAF